AVGAVESALGTPRRFGLDQFADDLDGLRRASSLLPPALEVRVGLPDLGPPEPPQPAAVSAPSGSETSTETDEGRDELPPRRPESLDSLAVGFAYEMLTKGERINVTEVARLVGCERTKLYDCPGFRALVEQDRKGAEARKRRMPRGIKDRDTRTVEAW